MDKKTAEYMEARVNKFKDLEKRKTYLEDKLENNECAVYLGGGNKISFSQEQTEQIKEFTKDIIKEELSAIEKQMEAI